MSDSYNLSRFVFWVIIVLITFIRVLIWYIYSPISYIGRGVRVKGLITSKQYQYTTLYYLNISGLPIELDITTRNTLMPLNLSDGELIEASGRLDWKSPGILKKGFTLQDATIAPFSTKQSFLRIAIFWTTRWASSIRTTFAKSLGKYFTKNEADLVDGFLLGHGDALDLSFYQRLQRAGLVHLIAASGYNMVIVISVVGGLATILIGSRRYLKLSIVIFLSLIYVLISGSEASVVRAASMTLVAYTASTIAGSTRSARRLFALVALLMLVIRPVWAWDVGYELSVAATVGILWFDPLLKSKIRVLTTLPELSTSFAASIATLPVIALQFGWRSLSVVGPVLTVLVTPFIPLVMAIGSVVLVLGLIWPGLAMAVAIVAKPVLWLILLLIDVGAASNAWILGTLGF